MKEELLNYNITRHTAELDILRDSIISKKNECSNSNIIELFNFKFQNVSKYSDIATTYSILSDWIRINPKYFILGNGSDEILKHLYMTLNYDSIQIFNHSYQMASVYNEILNKHIILNDFSYSSDNQFQIKHDIKKLGGDVLYIVNPHCPTGYKLSSNEIVELSNMFKYIIVDEAYTYPWTVDEVLFERNNIIIVKSFSKMTCVPGLRIGYAICSDEHIISRLNLLRNIYEINSIACDFISYACKNTPIFYYNQDEMYECYKLIKNLIKTPSIMCANFATFYNTTKLIGKQYVIDNNTFTRVTLTDTSNFYKLIL